MSDPDADIYIYHKKPLTLILSPQHHPCRARQRQTTMMMTTTRRSRVVPTPMTTAGSTRIPGTRHQRSVQEMRSRLRYWVKSVSASAPQTRTARVRRRSASATEPVACPASNQKPIILNI
ncbi:hypothetical protein B5X24_HaOG207669, partial [Helicoverpa armigera]